MLSLRISDNGSGPKTNDLKEIFQPFNSFGGKHKTNSGLGLYITKNILKKYNATIEAFYKKNIFYIEINVNYYPSKFQEDNPLQT